MLVELLEPARARIESALASWIASPAAPYREFKNDLWKSVAIDDRRVDLAVKAILGPQSWPAHQEPLE